MTQQTTADHSELLKLLEDWDAALVANDAERIAEFATADWSFVSQDGLMPGRQFLESVANGTVSHDTMSSEVVSVREFGDVAVVVARVINTGYYQGQRFENDEWTSDVFVRRDGRWRCELTHLTTARQGGA